MFRIHNSDILIRYNYSSSFWVAPKDSYIVDLSDLMMMMMMMMMMMIVRI